MERCKTCRHWQSFTPPRDTFGRTPLGYCILTDQDCGSPSHRQSLAQAVGGGCCTTYLVTSETFGCVQWEEREEREA